MKDETSGKAFNVLSFMIVFKICSKAALLSSKCCGETINTFGGNGGNRAPFVEEKACNSRN